MFSNLQRQVVLMLLASAAGNVLAAPAPVSDLNGDVEQQASTSGITSPETDVERLERLLQNRNQLQLTMQQQIDDMTVEVQQLRGQVEKNTHDMGQMLARQRELFVELDQLRSALKSKPAAAASSSDEQASVSGTFSENVDEQTAYQNAVDLILKKRNYAGAIDAFNKFQHDFPKSNFAPNAHYWLGQLYYAKQQDDKAVESFQAVLTFPKSNKRADALVKLGDLEKRRQHSDLANKYYQQVIDEYPDSASADVAKKSMSNK